MSGASASSAVRPRLTRRVSSVTSVLRLVAFPATVMVAVAAAVLALFSPVFVHFGLGFAGSAGALGVTAEAARQLSDRTIGELLFGPASFAFSGPDGAPFYGADEIAHLHDVRLVLFAFLGLAAVSAVALTLVAWRGRRDPDLWRAVAGAGAAIAIATGVLGLFAAVAFSFAFELFHRLLFPGGNWSFDPATQRLVQLYPLQFWQVTAAALGTLLVAGGAGIWWLARRQVRRLQGETRA